MPTYNYICNSCLTAAETVKGEPLQGDEHFEIIFETTHRMEPTPEELAEACVCPRCNGTDVEQTIMGCDPTWYVRGNGYLDKKGCHRAMNLHHLTTDDPYAEMREPGEADDLARRLRRGGEHNSHPQYFPPNSPTAPAANDAAAASTSSTETTNDG